MRALSGPVAPQSKAARSGPPGKRLHAALTGYAFAAPFLILFGLFMAMPIVVSLVLSFTDFSLGDLAAPLSAPFIGLQNYSHLLGDEKFRGAAFNTAYFAVVGEVLTLALGLAAAVSLNRGINRFRTVYRVGYYLPVVTSIVAIAVIWRFLLDPNFGLVNGALAKLGVHGPNWLGDPNLAMPCLIAVAVWRNLGNTMVLFLAGLHGISPDLYEASGIDGANRWQQFWQVTWPMLKPTTLFVAVITSIGFLQVFEEPFVMTQGGPLNKTLSVSMYMYEQGFSFFHLGYAASMAYVLFVVVAGVAFLQFRVLRDPTQ